MKLAKNLMLVGVNPNIVVVKENMKISGES